MKKIIAFALSVILILSICVFQGSAASQSELKNKISQLESESQKIESEIAGIKKQANNQQALADALQKKIDNTQAQINACNSEISSINSKISANKSQIKKCNEEIAENKVQLKKRLRAIYMSGNSSTLQILLGADSFSNYLQLQKLTESVSAHDKAVIEEIVSKIDELEQKQEENEQLLQEQVEIRATVKSKQAQLQSEQNEINSIISSLNSEQSELTSENKDVEAQLKKAKSELNELIRQASQKAYNSNNEEIKLSSLGFAWPVPGYYGISQWFGKTSFNSHHTGIDISGGGISGARIVAMADGVVDSTYYKNNWTRASGYYSFNSYGNYVMINHGSYQGKYYSSLYAHMSSVAVSPGQSVKQGQTIGYVGTTGNSTGYHLHFSIKINGSWVNPYPYVR